MRMTEMQEKLKRMRSIGRKMEKPKNKCLTVIKTGKKIEKLR